MRVLDAALLSRAYTERVTAVSPRVDARLLRAAELLDRPDQPFAETWRSVGLVADRIGVTRPAYDSIRLLLREHRRRREEIRRLLEPVASDLLRGRVSAWDVGRVVEAASLPRASSR